MRKKRWLVLPVIVTLLAAAGVAAVLLDGGGEKDVLPKPEETMLEFWLTEDAAEVDWLGYQEVPGWFGAREFLGRGYALTPEGERPEVYVSYLITAWPDYADGGAFVTGIEITDPAVTVYALTVESDYEDFDRVFREMGFEIESLDTCHRAVHGDFTAALTKGDRPSLRFSVQVSNRDNIVF